MSEEAPRLYLITPPITDAAGFVQKFEAALTAGDVACVLLRSAGGDPSAAKKIVRTLVPLAQQHGAACLVEDPQLAVRAGADGVHVEGSGEALDAAVASLKPDKIVGVGAIASRDEAMAAGEADVDYLMFGGADDARPFADILDFVGWWAEIFNVPCVAYARSLEEVAPLGRAGADFVALGAAIWDDPRGVEAAVKDAVQALAAVGEAAE